jgi:hypothetical protein
MKSVIGYIKVFILGLVEVAQIVFLSVMLGYSKVSWMNKRVILFVQVLANLATMSALVF